MASIGFLKLWLVLSIIGSISGVSYNQPKFCSNASWNSTAITFATNATVGISPYGIFVNTNNSVYVADRTNSRIQVWLNGSSTVTGNIIGGLNNPYSLFVTDNSDIYVDNGYSNYRVDKRRLNSTSSIPTMYMCAQCYGLFVDIKNMLYCSMFTYHQVISKSLDTNLNVWGIAAGTGTAGSTASTLYNPRGIFVDINLNLYVADSVNNRIQKFQPGQLNGATIAGTGAAGTIALNYPTAVVLDTDGYLFIVDSWNHRIVASGPNGFRCIAACSGNGSTPSQLSYPLTLSFDSYGNIFVTDQANNRIQKFLLAINSCSETATTSTTATLITSINSTESISLSTSTPQINSTMEPSSKLVSYNLPKFTANASWSLNGTTLASFVTGTYPYNLFVDTKNTLYVCASYLNRIQVWAEGNSIPIRNISSNLNTPYTIFVTIDGDIYIDNGYANYRVDKWALNATNSVTVMYVKKTCWGLFVDINNNIYCSMLDYHQVVTKSLINNLNMWKIAAGTDCLGSTSSTLTNPRGIFVDINLNLYVADFGNNRIQKFSPNQIDAITIAGATVPGTISLSGPTGIVLDGNGYLFIVDCWNHRIVASGPNGFRCVAGCSGKTGSAPNQLYYPTTMHFDTYGNMIVADDWNHRIQKFFLITNISSATTIKPAVVYTTNAIQTTVSRTITTVKTTTVPMTNSIQTTVSPMITTVKTTIVPMTTSIQTTVLSAASSIQTTVSPMITTVKTTIVPMANSIQTTVSPMITTVKTTIVPMTTSIQTTVSPMITTVKTTIVPMTSSIQTTVLSAASSIQTTVSPMITTVKTTIVPITSSIQTTVLSAASSIQTTVSPMITTVKTTVVPMTNSIQTTVSPTITTVKTTIVPMTNSIQTTVLSAASSIQTTVSPMITTVKTTIVPMTNSIQTTVSPMITTVKTTIVPMTNSIQTTVLSATSSIQPNVWSSTRLINITIDLATFSKPSTVVSSTQTIETKTTTMHSTTSSMKMTTTTTTTSTRNTAKTTAIQSNGCGRINGLLNIIMIYLLFLIISY